MIDTDKMAYSEGTERDAFEAEFSGCNLEAYTNGQYINPVVDGMWEGWRRRSISAAAILEAARAEGRREGMEEAAKVCEARSLSKFNPSGHWVALQGASDAIRALAAKETKNAEA